MMIGLQQLFKSNFLWRLLFYDLFVVIAGLLIGLGHIVSISSLFLI